MARPARTAMSAVLGFLLVTLLAGCAELVPGSATAAPEPLPAPGAAGTPLPAPDAALSPDEVGTNTVDALQEFWRAEFPATFGRPWTDLAAFVAVRTTDRGARPPP